MLGPAHRSFRDVFLESAQAVLEFQGLGMGVTEISHRSAPFKAVIEKAQTNLHQLNSASETSGLWLSTRVAGRSSLRPLC